MKSLSVNSCYNCPDRQLGCHVTCERYLKAKAEYEKMRDAYKEMLEMNPKIPKGSFLGDEQLLTNNRTGRRRRK